MNGRRAPMTCCGAARSWGCGWVETTRRRWRVSWRKAAGAKPPRMTGLPKRLPTILRIDFTWVKYRNDLMIFDKSRATGTRDETDWQGPMHSVASKKIEKVL